jgi:hypothetical protein
MTESTKFWSKRTGTAVLEGILGRNHKLARDTRSREGQMISKSPRDSRRCRAWHHCECKRIHRLLALKSSPLVQAALLEFMHDVGRLFVDTGNKILIFLTCSRQTTITDTESQPVFVYRIRLYSSRAPRRVPGMQKHTREGNVGASIPPRPIEMDKEYEPTLTGVKEHEYRPLPWLTMPGIMSTGPDILTEKLAPSAGPMKLSMHCK